MNKAFAFIGLVVLGAVFGSVIDSFVGVEYDDAVHGGEFIHQVAYLTWGGVLWNFCK